MVSSFSLFSMIFSFLISTFLAVSLMMYLKYKYNTSLKSFFVGMLAFLISVQILESGMHYYLLYINETTSNFINNNSFIYMLYGGFAAGIFEETARFLCLKYILKNYHEFDNGLAYGLGHGGIEAIFITGMASLYNYSIAKMINQGTYSTLYDVADAPVELLDGMFAQLTESSSFTFAMGGIERIFALVAHIGLTLLVLKAIKESKMKYYLYAILLHAFLNFPVALYQNGAISNAYIVEAWVLLFALGFGYFIYTEYKLQADNKEIISTNIKNNSPKTTYKSKKNKNK